MKFTQNTPVVSPNTINPPQVQAARDAMAYGTGGKDYTAMAGAIGQWAKVAQKEQDDKDAADVMEARNKIMGSLTENMYGEKGLLTTGVGENAKGLEGRVTDVVQKTFDTFSKQYNRRVQKALRGNLSENMANYQRIAAQQEAREFKKQKDSNYGLTIQNSTNMSMTNYQDENLLDSNINDLMRIVDYRAKDMGWNEGQRMQERRNVLTSIVGGTIQAAIDNDDLDTASIYNDRYGKYMNQDTVLKYQKVLRQETRLRDEKNELDELIKTHTGPTGEPDWNAIETEIKRKAKETKTVGGSSGGYFSDNTLNDEIMAAAKEYNVDPALVAAVAEAESNGSQNAVSSVGALGVMQLMPDTAASLGVDPNNRKDNIRGGAKYLRQMLDTFGGDVRKAVAAYNAGPGAVKEHGGVPPYKETQRYVAKILDGTDDSGEAFYEKYKKVKAGGGAVDMSGIPMNANMYDKGLAKTNNTLKREYVSLFHWAEDKFGKQMSVNGGWRSKEYNKSVNGSDTSHHLYGNAVDVDVSMFTDAERNAIIEEAKRRGFNAGGDSFYHDRGSGLHLHLTMEGKEGSPGHTVNVHDSGYEDRMIRRMEAMRSDYNRRKTDEGNTRLKGYEDQLKNVTDSGAVELLERIKASEPDAGIFSKAVSVARLYHPDAFKGTNSITGTRRSAGSRSVKYQGTDGETYTAAEIKKAKATIKRFWNDDKITEAEQDRYDNAAHILTAVGLYGDGDNLDNPKAFTVARQVWEQTQDYEKAHKWLMDVYDFSYNEATYYLDNME